MEFNYELLKEKYRITKTLRFELKPIGKTLENIKKDGVLEKDREKYNDYEKVKEILDEYYKNKIEIALQDVNFDWKELYDCQKKENKNEVIKKYNNKLDEHLKNYIEDIFKGKLLDKLQKDPELSEDDRKILIKFGQFTTYFTKFFKSRKNIFLSKGNGASIHNRIIKDNFAKFYKDIILYKSLTDEMKKNFEKYLLENEILYSGESLEDNFKVKHYNNLLKSEGIEKYNKLIGGLNELINKYNQKHKKKYVKFEPLYKQILSDNISSSFVLNTINTEDEALKIIDELLNEITEDKLSKIKIVIESLKKFDLSKIYISNELINILSNRMFKNYNLINLKIKKYIDFKANENKVIKIFSIQEISESLNINDVDLFFTELEKYILPDIENIIESIHEYYGMDRRNIKSTKNTLIIKNLLEGLNNFHKKIKYFDFLEKLDYDIEFYELLKESTIYFENINNIFLKIRNYMTKKDYVEKKYKLNFSNSELANGWSKSKEENSKTIIFRKKYKKDKNGEDTYKYYLAIINKNYKLNADDLTFNVENNDFEKMEYFLFPQSSKMIPKCSVAKKNCKTSNDDIILPKGKDFLEDFVINKDILKLYNNKEYLKEYINSQNDKTSLVKWIDFCKTFLKTYKSTSIYDFSKLKESFEYNDVSEFYNDVDKNTYKIEFIPVSENFLYNCVDEGKIYLFEIYSKDFSEYSTGNTNLHTMYFKELFSKENLKNTIFKLNGEAELFYRKKSEKESFKHKQGEKIVNKTYLSNDEYKTIPDNLYIEIVRRVKNNEEYESYAKENGITNLKIKNLEHEIVKDKRYYENKFLFHVPITINFKAKEYKQKNFNNSIINIIKECDTFNFIGIDRGERNLLSICVIDSKGNILEQENLNSLDTSRGKESKKVKVDFKEKLEIKTKDRDYSRKNWLEISNIKELKGGYLSNVIHKILKLAYKYNAFIILENLNSGFKNSRKKFEKQVYQKFEKMLIDKMNLLVFKDKKMNELGGLRNPLQLSTKIESFEKMKYHQGILLYVDPAYTSVVDPTTGFANIIKFNSINKDKIIENILSINYDNRLKMFRFELDLKKFKLSFNYIIKTTWFIYTNGKRIKYNKENKKYEEIDLTNKMIEILNAKGIDFSNCNNIKDKIVSSNLKTEIGEIFILALKLRNSNENMDYIISPVLNENNEFYNSNNGNKKLPLDADLNGAYNIARKGKIIFENLRKSNNDKFDILKNSDWLNYIQGNQNG